MIISSKMLFAIPFLWAGAAIPTAAHADLLVNASARTQCLDMSSGSGRMSTCNGSASQNFISTYGAQRLNGLCLQGTGGNNATNTLSLKPCNGSKDQQWAISNNGNFKNEGGWCAAATRTSTVIAAQCYGGGTYAWSTGRFVSILVAPPTAIKLKTAPAGATDNSAGAQVTKGGVSIISQDGGSIVAQGGGNIVAQGGGNVIVTTGGSIVAQGGGN